MHEDTELAGVQGTAGISRRDMLRKSAVVGGAGALMWAAPSITKFGGAAFGDEHGNGTPASDFSNFGAVVICTPPATAEDPDPEPTLYRIKGDADNSGPEFTWSTEHGSLGGCEDFVPDWGIANDAFGPDLGASFVQDGDNYKLILGPLPLGSDYEGCEFSFYFDDENNVEAAAASLKQSICCIGPATATANELVWHGPFGAHPNSPDPCDEHDDFIGYGN